MNSIKIFISTLWIFLLGVAQAGYWEALPAYEVLKRKDEFKPPAQLETLDERDAQA